MAQRHISLPKTFASGDISEWLKRFEICCKANAWEAEIKALKLPTLLEGEALAVWLELTDAEQGDYETAKRKLIAKLKPAEFVSLDEFHSRKLRPEEPLSLFVHELKQLLEQAMPGIDPATSKQLLLHQFIAGLPTEVSRQIRASGDTKELDSVVDRARLLMAMDWQERTPQQGARLEPAGQEMRQLQEQIASLSEQVAALTTSQTTKQQKGRCFCCNQVGHTQYNCPRSRRQYQSRTPRRCFNCGRLGHLARDCWQGNDGGMPANRGTGRRPQNL